jgi:ferredoxin--NADP+ reductase
VGNGNVAIDTARILLRDPHELESSEISETALKELMGCKISNVEVVGRRGVTHSAFSLK